MPLEAKDQRHLTIAEGYEELGLYQDADWELEEIAPELRDAQEVLAVRVRIYRGLQSWDLMQTVAGRLAAIDPDHIQWAVLMAYATRRAQSIAAARQLLLKAVERHPEAPVLHFNLACYQCQSGELEVAHGRLRHAFKLDPKLLLALEDKDLKPLWDSLAD